MQFVANYWWVWLVMMVLSGGYALKIQLGNMKAVTSFDFNGVASGVKKLVVPSGIAGVSFILLVIGVLAKIFS